VVFRDVFFLNNTWFHPDLLQLLLWFLAHTGLKGLVGPMYLPPGTEGKQSSWIFI
jgi:predicted small lipoprotein YifL